MRRLVVVAVSAAVLALTGGSTAFAGEVKGPPNQLNNTNETGALDHANSACAASGLNDFDLSDEEGQIASQVRTAADSGSSTAFRRVPEARSDSAGAEPARGETRLASAFGRGHPAIQRGPRSIHRLAHSHPGTMRLSNERLLGGRYRCVSIAHGAVPRISSGESVDWFVPSN